ncbi:MAG: phosphoadenylyl-sulfate reductase [Alphaproteobacteria bacterium]
MTATSITETAELVTRLRTAHGHLDAPDLLREMILHTFPGRIALTSSFGAEAAVLLDLVAAVNPATPVVFLDTGALFGETRRYRDQLVERLGLTDLRIVTPSDAAVAVLDPDGTLWRRDPDACCRLRKVAPLRQAMAGFTAWITGRKRFHGFERSALQAIEADGSRIKINPLWDWSAERLAAHAEDRGLPVHPLLEDGYQSIGCLPCTERAAPDEGARAGRWRGQAKTECGIHFSGL